MIHKSFQNRATYVINTTVEIIWDLTYSFSNKSLNLKRIFHWQKCNTQLIDYYLYKAQNKFRVIIKNELSHNWVVEDCCTRSYDIIIYYNFTLITTKSTKHGIRSGTGRYTLQSKRCLLGREVGTKFVHVFVTTSQESMKRVSNRVYAVSRLRWTIIYSIYTLFPHYMVSQLHSLACQL